MISGAIVSLIIALSKDEPSNIPKLSVDDYRTLQQDGDLWSDESGMSSADQQELDTLVEKAKAASESGDYEQADILFERAFAIGGLNNDAEMWALYYQHGRSLKERGLLEDALVKFRLANSVARPATRLAESKEEEGMVLFELGSVSEGIEKLEEAVELNYDNPWIPYHLGERLNQLGQREEAIPHFEQSIELGSTDGWAQKKLAELKLYHVPDYKTAYDLLVQNEGVGPDAANTAYWRRRAFASIKLENWENARAESTRGLSVTADDKYVKELRELLAMANDKLNVKAPTPMGDAKLPTAGLIMHFPIDGKFEDANGNELVVESQGDDKPENKPGWFFNGINNRTIIHCDDLLPIANQSRTVAVMFHATNAPGSRNILSWGTAAFNHGKGRRFSLGIRGEEELFVVGQNLDHHFQRSAICNNWNTFVVSYTGGGVGNGKCFVNGELASQFSLQFDTARSPLVIGSNTLDREDEYFGGTINEVLIYDRHLTDHEILIVHHNLAENLKNNPNIKARINADYTESTSKGNLPLSLNERSLLNESLAKARVALAERNLDIVTEQLAIATPLARTKESAAATRRLKMMLELVTQFNHLSNQAMDSYQSGSEIIVGTSTKAVVVEVSATKLTIKSAGVIRSYPRNRLSVGVAMGIAQTNFNDPVMTPFMKAAYLVTLKGDRYQKQAREFWQSGNSSRAKIDADIFDAFVADRYDF